MLNTEAARADFKESRPEELSHPLCAVAFLLHVGMIFPFDVPPWAVLAGAAAPPPSGNRRPHPNPSPATGCASKKQQDRLLISPSESIGR